MLSGTIVRHDVSYSPTGVGATAAILGAGFNHRADPAALELGPAGFVYSPSNASNVTLPTKRALHG